MVDIIFGVLGMILYPLFSIIFILLDTLQGVFYALAGIGNLTYGEEFFDNVPITSGNSGGTTDTGLIYYLLNSDLVKNMFMSILLLAIFLLIIFTVMAFLKNAYSAKPKSWKEIIGNALKGIMNFVFVPVCCFLGVWVGNILLNAINGATSQGGSTLMSRKLFIAAAYNANHYRTGIEEGSWLLKWSWDLAFATDWLGLGAGIPFEKEAITDNLSQDEMANMMDQVFASGSISIYDWYTVSQGYSLYQINYLTLIVGGVFMLYVLISLAYAMVRRMFILLMLFIISPAMCAMYPLDDGKALGQWRGDFLKQVISAYGAVAGMNLFFSLLPIVENIRFGTNLLSRFINAFFPVDTIIQLLIMIAGLFVVKEFISMISGYIGADNAYQQGTSLRKSVTDKIKDTAKKGVGVYAKAKGAKAAGGSFGKAMFKGTMSAFGFDFSEEMKKAYKDAFKEGNEHYFDDKEEKIKEKKTKTDFEKAKFDGLSLEDHLFNVKFNMLPGRNLTNEQRTERANEIIGGLKESGASDDVVKKAAEELARIFNEKMKDSNGKEKVWKADKMISDYTESKSNAAQASSIVEAGAAHNEIVSKRNAVQAQMQNLEGLLGARNIRPDSVTGLIDGGNLKAKLEADKILAANGDKDALDRVTKNTNTLNKIDEYNKLKESSDYFNEKIEASAKQLAQSIQSMSKEGVKIDVTDLEATLKTMSGSSTTNIDSLEAIKQTLEKNASLLSKAQKETKEAIVKNQNASNNGNNSNNNSKP